MAGLPVTFRWAPYTFNQWLDRHDVDGDVASLVSASSAESVARFGCDEDRVLVVEVVCDGSSVEIVGVAAAWGAGRAISELSLPASWLGRLGIGVVVLDRSGTQVLLARRRVEGDCWGLWHTAANEGVELIEVTGADICDMAHRALAEECGISDDVVVSVEVIGMVALGRAGWALCTVAVTSLSAEELLAAAVRAPDGWEGDPAVLSVEKVKEMLLDEDQWTSLGVVAHRLALHDR